MEYLYKISKAAKSAMETQEPVIGESLKHAITPEKVLAVLKEENR